jgi:Na+/glutamate symporter
MCHNTQAARNRIPIALGGLLGAGYLLGSAIGHVVCRAHGSLLGYCSAIWDGGALGLALAAATFGFVFTRLLPGPPLPFNRRAAVIGSTGWLVAMVLWLAMHAWLGQFLDQMG